MTGWREPSRQCATRCILERSYANPCPCGVHVVPRCGCWRVADSCVVRRLHPHTPAQLGERVAIVTTTGKDPLVSQCFGELVRDEWPRVFFSLSFKHWTPVPQDSIVRRRLAGTWVTATASVADRYTFAANGRFASAAAAMTVTRISPTELLQTTNAYFGDGSYRIAGNRIELAMDRDRTHPQRGFIRLEQDSQDGMSWKDRLCLLLEGIGEVCYGRE